MIYVFKESLLWNELRRRIYTVKNRTIFHWLWKTHENYVLFFLYIHKCTLNLSQTNLLYSFHEQNFSTRPELLLTHWPVLCVSRAFYSYACWYIYNVKITRAHRNKVWSLSSHYHQGKKTDIGQTTLTKISSKRKAFLSSVLMRFMQCNL